MPSTLWLELCADGCEEEPGRGRAGPGSWERRHPGEKEPACSLLGESDSLWSSVPVSEH